MAAHDKLPPDAVDNQAEVLRRTEQRKRSTTVQAVSAVAAALLVCVLVGSWFLVTPIMGKRQSPLPKAAGIASVASPVVFQPSIYPSPHAIGKSLNPFLCPSLSGLQTPSRGVTQGILAALNGFLFARPKLQAQIYADRAAWPIMDNIWTTPGNTPPRAALSPTDVKILPARGSTYAPVYQSLCGTHIVADSWLTIWCTSSFTGFPLTPGMCLQKQPAMTNYYYFLDRNGHWLLWGVQGGG